MPQNDIQVPDSQVGELTCLPAYTPPFLSNRDPNNEYATNSATAQKCPSTTNQLIEWNNKIWSFIS